MFHMKGANSTCMSPCGWLRVEDKWAISLVLSINVSRKGYSYIPCRTSNSSVQNHIVC